VVASGSGPHASHHLISLTVESASVHAAHPRRAHVDDPALRIVRLGYSYEDPAPVGSDALSDTGLLFGAWQADVNRQFVPIQRALDEADLLNVWTTPVGSAVFAIPPGCREGGYLGEALLAV